MKKKLKKIIPLILAVSLILGMIPAAALADDSTEVTASGTCGDNLTWELTSDGTLTISGTGEMEDYREEEAPWYSYTGEITSAIIEEGVTSIGSFAFYCCFSLTYIEIPDSVTSIGEEAFFWCNGLTYIEIPGSVVSIGNSAFSSCNGLTDIKISDGVPSIGEGAFTCCTSLTYIEIPDSVTSIGGGAFTCCTSLTYIEIPDSVTSIGESAFAFCTSLTGIVIPVSVTSIGYYSFIYCNSLTDVYYAGSEDEWETMMSMGLGSAYDCLTSATIHYNSTGPDGTCGEGLTWSFNSDSGMLTISGEGAMDDWDAFTLEEVPWYDYLYQITSINIKDGVTTIGQCAFNDCENLEFVMLPSSLESIGAYAFNCYSEVFTDVYYAGSSAEWLVFTDEENANVSEIGNDELLDAVIHYSCIGKLGLETDIWSFTNNKNFFFNDGYYITDSDALTLVSNLSEVDKNLVLIEDYWTASDIITNLFGDNFSWYCRLYLDDMTAEAETWDGSCYGMAAWVALNAAGILDASDIDSTESYLANYISSSLLHDSDNLQSDAVQSAINFYHVQQYMTAASEMMDEFMSSYTQKEQLSLLETLAEEAQEGGNPVIVHFQYYELYESDGITCDTSSGSGHSIIAYGTEDGDYTDTVKNYWRIYAYDDAEGGYIYVDGYDDEIDPVSSAEFTHRILIYDPNHINDDGQFYIYYNDDGVWCIPGYGVISTESSSRDTIYNNGQLRLVTADTEAIDLVDYNTGELSCIASGDVDAVSYITSLFTNDYSVSWSGGSADISGFSVYNNTSDETINVVVEENVTADGESTSASSAAFLPESDEYTVTFEDEEVFFYLNTGNYLTMAATTSSGSITFRNDGGAAVTTDGEAAAYISVTANDGYTDLDWCRFEVFVEETTDISAELTDEGILISGGDLTDVIINGISDDEDACITVEFSTDEDTALVTTDEDDELAVLIDADNDGTFETSVYYELYDDDSSGTTGSEDDSSDEETEEETEPETEEETEPEGESETEEETEESSDGDDSDGDSGNGDTEGNDSSDEEETSAPSDSDDDTENNDGSDESDDGDTDSSDDTLAEPPLDPLNPDTDDNETEDGDSEDEDIPAPLDPDGDTGEETEPETEEETEPEGESETEEETEGSSDGDDSDGDSGSGDTEEDNSTGSDDDSSLAEPPLDLEDSGDDDSSDDETTPAPLDPDDSTGDSGSDDGSTDGTDTDNDSSGNGGSGDADVDDGGFDSDGSGDADVGSGESSGTDSEGTSGEDTDDQAADDNYDISGTETGGQDTGDDSSAGGTSQEGISGSGEIQDSESDTAGDASDILQEEETGSQSTSADEDNSAADTTEDSGTDSEASAEDTSDSSESAATGDSNSLLFWLAVGVLALAPLVTAAARRKSNK